MNLDDLPLTSQQMSIIGMLGLVVLVSLAAPAVFAPDTTTSAPENNGTVYSTPEPQSEPTAQTGPSDNSSGVETGQIQRLSYESADLNTVPESHVSATNQSDEPDVASSTGAQTLRVETTTVNGTAALNLTDDQTHDGRWVSVSTDWLEQNHGSIPNVATIAHENGSVYTEDVSVRDGQAVFWVRGFSSNLVTFGGELEIVDRPGTTGTTHIYEVNDLDNATDPVLELTGQETTERDTASATAVADGGSLALSVADTTLSPTNPEVTFTGREQVTTDDTLVNSTFSDGESTTYTVDGNVPAENVSVIFTGQETTTLQTASASNLANGETTSYTVNGNRPANQTSVTFEGDTTTSTASSSATGLSPSGSDSISINGNLDPTGDSTNNNPVLSVTGYGSTSTTNVVNDQGDGATDGNRPGIGDYANNNDIDGAEFTFVPSESGEVSSVTVYVEVASGSDYVGNVDVSLVNETADEDYSDGRSVATWDPSWSTGGQTITFDSPQPVQAGQPYTVQWSTQGSDSDGTEDSLDFRFDDSGTDYYWSTNNDAEQYHADMDYTMTSAVSGLTASSTGASVTVGTVQDGETETVEYPLSHDASQIDFTADSGDSIDYELNYTERTATEDPSVDVDGDGSTDASYNGILTSGQTHSESISNIPTGSQTATVSTTAHQTDLTIDYTERTATEDPSIDLNGDGTTDASYSGLLTGGSTVTRDVGNISSGTHTATASLTAYQVHVEAGSTTTTATEDPAIDIDGDNTPEASYTGTLAEGETQTVAIDEFDSSVSEANVSLANGTVDLDVSYTERVQSTDAGVIVNGNELRMSGTLGDGNTTTLVGNSSWLQSGNNNVTVVAGDGTLSNDAPERRVNLTYSHDLETQRSVLYEDEIYSERYNLSRTYLSDRQNATLTIQHADNVIAMRSLETRINESGGWTSVPDSAYELDGTTLVLDISSLFGGEVPAGSTVEMRSVGSKINVYNGSVTVEEATPVGYDLDSRVRLDSWAADSYVGVGNTSQGTLLNYASNETFSAESDYAEFSGKHGQRLHFPDAVSGSAVTIHSLPLLFDSNGTIRVSVPEDSANTSSPAFYVNPGQTGGDSFNVTYVAASEGEWYGAFEVNTSNRLDRAQGRNAMTIPSDDIDSLIRVRNASSPESEGNATSLFAVVSQGNLLGLTILFSAIGFLFVIGQRPERSRQVVRSAGSRAAGLAGRVPRIGNSLTDPVESAVVAVGDTLVTVGENRILTGAVSAAVLAAAIQSGYLDVGPELGAMLAVAGIALGSLILLVRINKFTTARWGGVVMATSVIALQALGEGDLLVALVNSDAFIIILVGVGYVAIQLVREYRANNSPNDDRPQVVIETDGGEDDDGGEN